MREVSRFFVMHLGVTDNLIGSLVANINHTVGLLIAVPSWFDQFIMAWPAVLGQELQKPMDKKVCTLFGRTSD